MPRNETTTTRKQPKPEIAHDVMETIPYIQAYESGIFEIRQGVFSQSYMIPDTNFKKVSEEKQFDIAENWSNFMNTLDASMEAEVTMFNRTIDIDDFERKVFLDVRADSLNDYREEYNQMLKDKMLGARNNIETVKILTISVEAPDIIEATEKFAQINTVVADSMSTMTKEGTEPMSLVERLDILNQIMKGDDAKPIYQQKMIDGHMSESFSLENCEKQGITTKEVIAPASFEFAGNNNSKVGDRLVKSYFISSYPTYIKGTILTDFTQIPANMLTSVYYTPYDQVESVKMIKEKGTNINAQVIDSQKRGARSGIFGDIAVSPKLQQAQEEIEELSDKMNKDDMRLFTVTFIFSLFADTEEEMKKYEDQLKMIAAKNLLQVQPLNLQQETGFASALPLGNNKLYVQRLMTSISIASIIPFDVTEVRQKNGKYYGLNAVSGNMLLYDRTDDVNPDACILGMPGAGKSFLTKQEITSILLGTDDYVYVLDPEREYKILAEKYNGTTIELSQSSKTHINPFDLNLENADEGTDPIKAKSDFIEGLIEIMIGGRIGLSPIEKSIIGRSVAEIYEPYVQRLKRTRKTYDPETAPTIRDFYESLKRQNQMEALNLSLSLERFVSGSQDAFSHRTNVNINDRFIVYDTKDIGSGLKESGQYIALDNVFNKIIDNFANGIRTWLYVDEFHNLMQKETSATYIQEIWKRARKWNGLPCAITQNVEDMLKSPSARTVINNSNLVILLGQSSINKQQLAQMLDISPDEEKYIGAVKPGTGIMHIESLGANIPFINEFPRDTELYRIMSTKADERVV